MVTVDGCVYDADDFELVVQPQTRTFATKGDLIDALRKGEIWETRNIKHFYDENYSMPFRYSNKIYISAEVCGFSYCDGETLWTRVD